MFKDLNQGQTQYSQTFYNEKVYIDWLKAFLSSDNTTFNIDNLYFESFLIIGDKDHPDAIYLYYYKNPQNSDKYTIISWNSDLQKYVKKN